MFEEVLDFDSGIKGEGGKFLVHAAYDTKRMGWSVPEVGVAKGDVLCATLDLGTNVGQDDVCGHGEETTIVDGGNWAMAAGMFTATCGFGVACWPTLTVPLQMGVLGKLWQGVACGHEKLCTL